MRKLLILAPLYCLVLYSQAINAQQVIAQPGGMDAHKPSMMGPPVAPRDLSAFSNIVNINGQDGFYLRKNLYLNDLTTNVDGQMVLGTPFLFWEWFSGYLTTADNRKYDTYKFRYNVYNQTVSFLNGKDSLDVDDVISEFVLNIPQGDSIVTSRFVNADQYKKEKTPFYYEVLLDNARGQLLKTNKKIITTENKDGLMSTQGRKYFNLIFTYFYFDKTTKKITKIRPDGSNMAALLGLSEEESRNLDLSSFDLSKEDDMIKFLKRYFEKAKKAF
jgi:hypothetical protein